ncbi:transcription elongation regulator [Linnemannia exigua]|uniref:Transcription elongation regulator n=1 Tax=Linnemannia exigua TaxID=604196 RepID=A0AAD4DMC3_9FUNG|nr:transcription elongation regulator [Linnemannia exigua]
MNHPPPHHHHQQGAPGLPPPGRFPEPGGPPPPFINGPPPHQPILGGPPGVAGGALFGAPPPPPPPGFMPPPNMMLPPGWTEHKAPDGMAYFYNAATGSSSWVRPTMQPSMPPPPGIPGMGIPPPPGMSRYPPTQQPLYPPGVAPPPGLAPPGIAPTPITPTDDTGKGKRGKRNKKEKAVKKTRILDSPWFIVETNMDNTFFYNKETKVSIWIPTPELEIVLIKMGQVATEKAEAERRARDAEEQERLQALKRPFEMDAGRQGDGDKRFRNDAGQEAQGTEMTEDDVAWQLAAMEEMMGDQDQDHHMASQDEYDDDEDEEDDSAMQERLRMLQGSSAARAAANLEIIPENIQEREMAFWDMMRERGVTQFDTADMALGKVEKDPRYRLIPDKKDKIALFDSYCVIRAREIKEAKEKEEQKEEKEEEERDPRTKDKHNSSSRDSKSHTTSSSTSASKTSNKPEDVYRRLVEEYTTKTSSWLDFMTKYRVDPRFLGLKPGSLRESVFRQYLSDLKKGIIQPPSKSRGDSSSDKDKRSSSSSSHSRSSSTKYKATDAEIDEFMSLLKETKKDILYEHKNSSSVEWRKIKKLIDRDRRYDAVGSSTERELLFRKYADRVIQRRD